MRRDPRGVPTGGRFARQGRDEADVDLRSPVSVVDTVSADLEAGATIMERRRALRGSPHQGARTAAVAVMTGYPERLDDLAGTGAEVTVIYRDDTGSVATLEGRVSDDGASLERDGRLLMSLRTEKFQVFDVDGPGASQALADRYRDRERLVPELSAADFSHLPDSPDGTVTAAYVVTYVDGEKDAPGTVLFASHREGDTVHGHLVLTGSDRAVPAQVSTLALSRRGGSVTGYRSGGLRTDDIAAAGRSVTTTRAFSLLRGEA